MPRKKTLPSKPKRIKAIARERVGTVQPSRPIEERQNRSRPKHKKRDEESTDASGG